MFKQKQAWRAQLREADAPAPALLLACLLLFHQVHRTALVQAPGKLVPALLAHLRQGDRLPETALSVLADLQTVVIDQSKGVTLDAATVTTRIDAVRRLALAEGTYVQ